MDNSSVVLLVAYLYRIIRVFEQLLLAVSKISVRNGRLCGEGLDADTQTLQTPYNK